MPINFNLEQLRTEHGCSTYLETGLYDPKEDISIKKALAAGFEKVFSIEIRKGFVVIGNQIFQTDVRTGRCSIINDDSTNLKNHLSDPAFKNKTMFFLDAHVDNTLIQNFTKMCPLFDELEAIGSLERKDNIILVDDLRIITTPFPWGEQSYGDIDFLSRIKAKILSINKDYKFKTLEGHIADDVLLAYI
jgi:hypothetical protein